MIAKKSLALSLLCAGLLISAAPCFSADPNNGEALQRAIVLGDVPKLKELLAQGADANSIQGDRPLLGWAAQNGNVEIVRTLLEAKAAVDATDTGLQETPLLRAIENQHSEVVKELLKFKANPNAKDPRGETALARAVKYEKADIVQALIEAGADVKYTSADGDTLALLATQANTSASPEIVKLLGKAKADLNSPNLVYTPLYYATQNGSVELVKTLLEAGANPNQTAPSGRVPLYYAINNEQITELLLNAKADPNLISDGASPILIAAIENGTDEVVKALIKGGANVNIYDGSGNSALKVAQNYSKTNMAELLKANGATE